MTLGLTGVVAFPPRLAASDTAKIGTLVVGALALGAAVSLRPTLAAAVALALVAVAVIATYPVVGVYAVIVLTPLTAGIDRGTLLPVLRPNEAVSGLVATALFLRWILSMRSARDFRIRIDKVSASLLALAVTSSIIPLLWMRLQGLTTTSDDLLYSLLIWKFVIVFLIVRSARLNERQIWRSLQLSVAAAVVVSAVALLQTAKWGPVVSLLKAYYTTNSNVGAITSARGGSTLGLPIAVADLLTFNLAIVMAMIWVRRRPVPLLYGIALVLTIGVVGAGEFSGLIGLVVGVITMCLVMRTGFPAKFFIIGGAIAVPVVWPVIQTRLAGFQSLSGLPVSWTGRLNNLHEHFWPVLFAHHRYLLGVRPAARIAAPHRANGYIWIESGYTWLFWAGGIPLFLAFVWFIITSGRIALRAVKLRSEAGRVAGVATFVAVTVITVLMLFDPHLTYRGVADELFALLALCITALGARSRGDENV